MDANMISEVWMQTCFLHAEAYKLLQDDQTNAVNPVMSNIAFASSQQNNQDLVY